METKIFNGHMKDVPIGWLLKEKLDNDSWLIEKKIDFKALQNHFKEYNKLLVEKLTGESNGSK